MDSYEPTEDEMNYHRYKRSSYMRNSRSDHALLIKIWITAAVITASVILIIVL
jgi:hypothetical protein